MTREEALEFIAQSIKSDVDMAKVADALKALEQKPIIDKIRAEIERQEKWLMVAGYNQYNVDIAFNAIKLVVDKYKAESEE